MNQRLLHYILTIVLTGLLNTACKKERPPAIIYRTLKVLELKTNLPIGGATVKIYECTKQGFGGCSEYTLLRTLTTDKDGNIQFDSRLNVSSADASHEQYWDGGSGGQDFWGNTLPLGDIHLIPVANTKIHLKKINPHAPESSLIVNVNQDPHSIFFDGTSYSFHQPADTTLVLSSYGYMNNIIDWYFMDGMGNIDTTDVGGQLPSYYINRFDTAAVEINY